MSNSEQHHKDNDVDIVKAKRVHPKQPSNTVYRAILGVIVLIVVIAISFYSGIAYQKHKTTTNLSTASSARGGAGGFGGRFSGNRAVGSVTAVTSTSVTIRGQNSSTTTTYTINSSTMISDNGQTVAASDIQTGDTVFITTSSTTSTVATRILVNPSFGGFGGGGSSSGSSDPSSSSGSVNTL